MSRKSNKIKVEYEGSVDIGRAAEYLEQVVAALRQGTVSVALDGERVTVHPGAVVRLDVEAKQKEGKETLSFKVKWRRGEEAVADTAAPLRISSAEEPAAPRTAEPVEPGGPITAEQAPPPGAD